MDYLDNVRVCQQEGCVDALHTALEEHLLEVVPELRDAVCLVQREAEELTVGNVAGQMDDGGLPCPIQTHLLEEIQTWASVGVEGTTEM